MKKDIMDYWPSPDLKPRETQIQILKWIESQPDNIKYFLVEAPTGSGKSVMALTASNYFAQSNVGSAYILTPQKILQKQYEDTFGAKVYSFYGQNNYTCSPKNTTCRVGLSITPKCEMCPYVTAYDKAMCAPNLVLSYALGLNIFASILTRKNSYKMPKKSLCVFDECHTLEHHLTELRAISISELRCKLIQAKWRIPSTETDAFYFINDKYLPQLISWLTSQSDLVKDIQDKINQGMTLSKQDISIINRFKEMEEHRNKISELVKNKEELFEKFVYIKDKTFFKFKELYGRNIFNTFVKPSANKFLFMSSTILDKEAYCSDIGIPPEETAFLSVGSEFNRDNRPIFFIPSGKMTYGWDKEESRAMRQSMLREIISICTDHVQENGIIHTGSFQIAKWLTEELENKIPQQILDHNPMTSKSEVSRDDVIAEFMAESPARKVLISPSITEGLDLKGDHGRFAIIVKIPYPYMGDAWVKKRMTISNDWYRRQAMIGVIQGAGRIVRTSDDWGITYILDGAFTYLYKHIETSTPRWWKDALVDWNNSLTF